MNRKEIIKKTVEFSKDKLKNGTIGHEWSHTERVRKIAKEIAQKEKADMFIVEISALLHDVFDHKFFDEKLAQEKIEKYLRQFKLDKGTEEHIKNIVANISFKGAGVKNKISTLEGKVVQDADRLDAIGAIGIARVFSYGAHANREFYDPKIKPVLHTSPEKYKNAKSTSINHFYEKLLLLKDRMNTQAAKKMATKRHRFLEEFLKEFFAEWEGKQ